MCQSEAKDVNCILIPARQQEDLEYVSKNLGNLLLMPMMSKTVNELLLSSQGRKIDRDIKTLLHTIPARNLGVIWWKETRDVLKGKQNLFIELDTNACICFLLV